MKNKKGFTLIELLAVIVILAIIALIATPIILNMIENAKKGAAKDSAYGYIEAIEKNNALADFNNKYQKITATDVDEINDQINVKGKKALAGEVEYNNNIVSYAYLCIGGYYVEYNHNKAEVIKKCDTKSLEKSNITINNQEATSKEIKINYSIIDDNGIDSVKCYYSKDTSYNLEGTISDNTCLMKNLESSTIYNYRITVINKLGTMTKKNGKITTLEPEKIIKRATSETVTNGNIPNGNFAAGDEYLIKVNNESDYYHFFVLSVDNESDKVNLILDRNIDANGKPTVELQANDEWYNSKSINQYGPITAYAFLSSSTDNWDNIPNININYRDESNVSNSSYGYNSIATSINADNEYITKILSRSGTESSGGIYKNLKTRLPYKSELISIGCDSSACPLWAQYYLSERGTSNNLLGYWFSTSSGTENSYIMHYVSRIKVTKSNHTGIGIRPVITLNKTDLEPK